MHAFTLDKGIDLKDKNVVDKFGSADGITKINECSNQGNAFIIERSGTELNCV